MNKDLLDHLDLKYNNNKYIDDMSIIEIKDIEKPYNQH